MLVTFEVINNSSISRYRRRERARSGRNTQGRLTGQQKELVGLKTSATLATECGADLLDMKEWLPTSLS